jgi:hypothetical protein
MHSLALLEFKTPSAQKPSRIPLALLLSCSSPHLLSCTSVLVGTRHHPSTSTASLVKPRRLRWGRFTRPCIYTCNKTNGRNASHRWRWIPPCCDASCLTYYAVAVSACTGWNEVCVRSVVSKATEIATAKVYEVMHVNMQQRPMAKMPRSDGDGFCLVLSHRLRRAGQPACRMRLGVCLQHRQLPLSETSGLISIRRSSRGLVDYSCLCRLSSLVKEAATRRADICLRGCDRLDHWSFC